MKEFITLGDIAIHQEIVKDSAFLAYAARADTPEKAFEFLRVVLARHQDASHLCGQPKNGWSWRARKWSSKWVSST